VAATHSRPGRANYGCGYQQLTSLFLACQVMHIPSPAGSAPTGVVLQAAPGYVYTSGPAGAGAGSADDGGSNPLMSSLHWLRKDQPGLAAARQLLLRQGQAPAALGIIGRPGMCLTACSRHTGPAMHAGAARRPATERCSVHMPVWFGLPRGGAGSGASSLVEEQDIGAVDGNQVTIDAAWLQQDERVAGTGLAG